MGAKALGRRWRSTVTRPPPAPLASSQLPEPTPISPLLPDLFLGNGGLTLTASKGQAAVNKLIAMVLNRLAANAALPRKIDAAGHMTDQLRETFVVRLSNDADAASYTNVEDLVEALQRAGHEVKLGLGSNITSFGLGLCVKASDGNGWAHVPLGYPLSTGMWAAEDGRDLDVATLMSHASMQLQVQGACARAPSGRAHSGASWCAHVATVASPPPLLLLQITGPLVGHCHLEWCLSLAGFTGWGSYTSVKRDWQTGPEVMTWHKDGGMDTPAGRRRALRLATVSSCTLNIAASRSAMLIGGYAFLGEHGCACVYVCVGGGGGAPRPASAQAPTLAAQCKAPPPHNATRVLPLGPPSPCVLFTPRRVLGLGGCHPASDDGQLLLLPSHPGRRRQDVPAQDVL